jgi:hypothetical protein
MKPRWHNKPKVDENVNADARQQSPQAARRKQP